jgi:predicted kinase
MSEEPLPDPALVVLVGASGSGKSTWAQARYRAAEIVSSDDLRGVVGSGRHDLDASTEAFALLDLIVGGRVRRGLTTVVDTLGLDDVRRTGWLDLARVHGLPAVVVAFDADPELCRRRNARRDRPVPARVLTQQVRTFRSVRPVLAAEGWDRVLEVAAADVTPAPVATPQPDRQRGDGLDVVLQVSRSPGVTTRPRGCATSRSRRTRWASPGSRSWTT